MNNIIITSEIDENYFIINSGTFYITYLKDLVNKKNNEISQELSSINEMIKSPKDFIFVEKNSELGIIIKELIKEKDLIDGNQIIEESHLINSLINQTINKNYHGEYLNTIIKMIKNKDKGLIENLKEIYPEIILKEINKEGRFIWAINQNKTKEKYYKQIHMHGYESKGITYCNNRWFYIDIVNKCMTLVKNQKSKQKIRNNEKNKFIVFLCDKIL